MYKFNCSQTKSGKNLYVNKQSNNKPKGKLNCVVVTCLLYYFSTCLASDRCICWSFVVSLILPNTKWMVINVIFLNLRYWVNNQQDPKPQKNKWLIIKW